MHELPKDLTSSLRSFRGSVYGNSRSSQQHERTTDLEKGPEDYGDKEFDRALNQTESSLILHPTKSIRRMNQQVHPNNGDNGQQHEYQEKGNPQPQPNQQKQIDQRPHPQVDPHAPPAKQATFSPETPNKKSVYDAPPVKDSDPASDRLARDLKPLSAEDFYELMGLQRPGTHGGKEKPLIASPHGLYGMIVHETKRTASKYHAFDILAYVLLVIQLFLGALFIILGSLQKVDTHLTIAILGAVSTVIAGGLALMKGQGLPNRLRQSRDGLKNVIFEADELYWDFQAGMPVLFKDVKKVREDYLRVLDEERRNHPDAWNSITNKMEQGVQKVEGKVAGHK